MISRALRNRIFALRAEYWPISADSRLRPLRALAFVSLLLLAPASSINGQAATPHFTAMLHTPEVKVVTRPNASVSIELRSPDARLVGAAAGTANARGELTLELKHPANTQAAQVRPGQHISVIPHTGASALSSIAPTLSGAILDLPPRLVGVYNGTGTASWKIFNAPDSVVQEGEIDGIGEFSIALLDSVTPFPGQLGEIAVSESASISWVTLATAPRVILSKGAPMRGVASLGATIAVSRKTAEQGSRVLGRREVSNEVNWTLYQPYEGHSGHEAQISLEIMLDGMAEPLDIEAQEPNLAVNLHEATGVVYGTALPNTEIHVSVLRNSQPLLEVDTQSDADGRFEEQSSSLRELGPGWEVVASVGRLDSISFVSRNASNGVSVQLWGRYLEGVVPSPGAAVTMELHSPHGELLQEQHFVTNQNGEFGGSWDPVDGGILAPGHTVSLDWGTGDPVFFSLPHFDAVTAVKEGVIRGSIDDGLEVYIVSSDLEVVAGPFYPDARGDFTIRQENVQSPGSGDHGLLMTTLSSGHRIFVPWVVPRPEISLPSGPIGGNCAPARNVKIDVFSLSGQKLDTVSVDCRGATGISSMGRWTWEGIDSTGMPLSLPELGHFDVHAGTAQALRLDVPKINAAVDVLTDRVEGIVLPRGSSTLKFSRGREKFLLPVSPGTDGVFSTQFSSDWDAQIGDTDAVLAVEYPNYSATTTVTIPRLQLSLDSGYITGAMATISGTRLELERSGMLLASLVQGGGTGSEFEGSLVTSSGRIVVPESGDRIILRGETVAGMQELRFTVPEFTLVAQETQPQVYGRASSSGGVSVSARTHFRDSGVGISGISFPAVDVEGRYESRFNPPLAFYPGQVIRGRFTGDDGLVSLRENRQAMLNVQLPGDYVCGVANPSDALRIDYREVGSDSWTLGKSFSVDHSGEFSWRLVTSEKTPIRPDFGDELRLMVNSQVVSSIEIPSILLDLEWQTPRVQGSGPPNTLMHLDRPMDGCQTRRSYSGGFSTQRINSDSSGKFEFFVSPVRGESVQLWHLLPNGHRIYRPIIRNLLRIHLDSGMVSGRNSPQTIARANLNAANPLQDAAGEARSDFLGSYNLNLESDSEVIGVVPSEGTIAVDSESDQSNIELLDLTFDYSEETGVFGKAPAGQEIQVDFRLTDGRKPRLSRLADGAGSYRVLPTDLPAGSDWTFKDIESIEAIFYLPDSNSLSMKAFVRKTQTPTLYMPILSRRR